MISQTSSSPTARRNPYTCQDNMKLLHFIFFRPSSPLSLFKNVPLTNLFLPLHMRGMGCPPSTRSSGARSGGHPTSTICPSHSLTFSKLFTHPVVNVVCAPKQVENQPQDQKAQAGKQGVKFYENTHS